MDRPSLHWWRSTSTGQHNSAPSPQLASHSPVPVSSSQQRARSPTRRAALARLRAQSRSHTPAKKASTKHLISLESKHYLGGRGLSRLLNDSESRTRTKLSCAPATDAHLEGCRLGGLENSNNVRCETVPTGATLMHLCISTMGMVRSHGVLLQGYPQGSHLHGTWF
jgi:hypothetical protein